MTSRTQVADYLADKIFTGNNSKKVMIEVAAWLRSHNKTRQVDYLVSDVARALTKHGYYCISVTSARELSVATKKQVETSIKAMTGAITLECTYSIDHELIGGIVIKTPEAELDATIQSRLAKIIEGVK
jgi:F0F1-type ATP synthase delta subunit